MLFLILVLTITDNEHQVVLNKYKEIGASLRGTDFVKNLDTEIDEMSSSAINGARIPFCYVAASAGKGKTQLAFALDRKVCYIPYVNIEGICLVIRVLIVV